ncbi:hypothetical protein [Microbulbifer sp. TRSA007]|uniref:hypothetical protein n=1 Tax=Microbulbifer sp. TRSA007 TaxID=3243384 RepID=UPI00403904B8
MRLILPFMLSAALSGCFEAEANVNEYDRHEWLPRWSDADRDCQSTRHELLVQFSMAPVTFTNDKECTVDIGLWLDQYTGQFFNLASDLDVQAVEKLIYVFAFLDVIKY